MKTIIMCLDKKKKNSWTHPYFRIMSFNVRSLLIELILYDPTSYPLCYCIRRGARVPGTASAPVSGATSAPSAPAYGSSAHRRRSQTPHLCTTKQTILIIPHTRRVKREILQSSISKAKAIIIVTSYPQEGNQY